MSPPRKDCREGKQCISAPATATGTGAESGTKDWTKRARSDGPTAARPAYAMRSGVPTKQEHSLGSTSDGPDIQGEQEKTHFALAFPKTPLCPLGAHPNPTVVDTSPSTIGMKAGKRQASKVCLSLHLSISA